MTTVGTGHVKPFTKDQADKIVARLEEKATDICPSCTHTNLVVLPGVACIPMFDYSASDLDWKTPISILPNIVVLCANCGLTRFFNIHALDLAEVLGVGGPGSPLKKEESNG